MTSLTRLAASTTVLLVLLVPSDRTPAQIADTPGSDLTQPARQETYADFLVEQARGLLQDRRPDWGRAARLLEAAQWANNLDAIVLLAEILLTGDGVERNPKGAERLLNRAAQTGQRPAAWITLAKLYLDHPALGEPGSVARALERATELDDARARTAFARILADGRGVQRDVARAKWLLTEAMAVGESPESADILGDILSQSKSPDDIDQAIEAYRTAVFAGYAGTATKLVKLLVSRSKGLADFTEAERLLRAEIDSGDKSSAAEILGDLYRDSLIFGDRAANAYRIAADAGNPSAGLKLAGILITGDGVDQDFVQAEELLVSAAAAGHEKLAHKALAELYLGPLLDTKKAIVSLQVAADLGDARSMLKLGQIYESGAGIEANFDEAKSLFEAAAAAGAVRDAHISLGRLYSARGPNRDPKKAIEAYQRSADAGSIWAKVQVAQMTAAGNGVPADFNKAREILERAIKEPGNVSPAWIALGRLFAAPQAPFHDLELAVRAYSEAAKLGSSNAKVLLGRILSDGSINPPDLERARNLYEEALSSGATIPVAKWLGDLVLRLDRSPSGVTDATGYYELAAEAGNPEAHLLLATLGDPDFSNPTTRAVSLKHFKEAAASLDRRPVFAELMRLSPKNLILAVQQLLTDRGHRVAVDGILGRQTGAAILAFCKRGSIVGCDRKYVTTNFAIRLLTADGQQIEETRLGEVAAPPSGGDFKAIVLRGSRRIHNPGNLIPTATAATAAFSEAEIDKFKGEIPLIAAIYNVYIRENEIIYLKNDCKGDDLEKRFFLHVVPEDMDNIPAGSADFQNMDFKFRQFGTLSDGVCIAVRELPAYEIKVITTGQFVPNEGITWEGIVHPSAEMEH